MIYNFESWRRAKQKQFTDGQLRHYHRCSDVSYSLVREILQKILSGWVGHSQRQFILTPSDFDIELIYQFLSEMDFAYMHPRSTSARFIYQISASAK